jgi:hypothetical protein
VVVGGHVRFASWQEASVDAVDDDDPRRLFLRRCFDVAARLTYVNVVKHNVPAVRPGVMFMVMTTGISIGTSRGT